ncbi:ribonuclease H family protein [Companilactobacillus sp.]|uniref:ribonuclease H family protein n=1 Tax=Companilactobacillus sp. TaxID=2767905 RepID=UPI0025BB8F44|nr:ribonuclease H family protein [Companilactobacillus sp.]MCH4009026.1 ribonuclease H family protein [Companilactobacillus sp.]MCH4050795.1 ribonuclease H family protein [Companilactobacillus sp.]MCH4076968.1 ribonuclease H family protein [Companilactobacillus sp.]MCH4125544.1 ribonuclease H family protein [Companilactobacillus sp.]MCI1311253.1 ribonuclease H family protein [Companilactobacillus sp.]
MQKYYAVRRGRKPGIYRSWPECQKQVNGFENARYKSFTSQTEAEEFLKGKDDYPTKNKTSKKESENLDDYEIVVYTDGGSRNHGNYKGGHVKSSDKAAWAFHINHQGEIFEGTDDEFGATNNRMEIMALIESIKRLNELNLNDKKIIFVLDSQYVLNAITKGWLNGWKRRGYKKADGTAPANVELWQELDGLLPTVTNKAFSWTKGHAQDEGNNRVDALLNETMDKM